MPIYEFICLKCDDKFDKLVPFNWESAGVTCPNCASTELQKAVSLVGSFRSGSGSGSTGGSACGSCSSGSCNTCN